MGPGGAGCSGRDRQPETRARLRQRHGPAGQDRPGRCPADRPLWRGDAPGGDACCPTRRAPELREILAGRRQLVAEIAARKQQLEHLRSPLVRARVAKALAFLQEEAKTLLALLRERIAADRRSQPTSRC